ncbi:hypothetical protein D3C73_1337710 [compost metagenome]
MARHFIQLLALLGQRYIQLALIVNRFQTEDQLVALHARQNAGQAGAQNAGFCRQLVELN